MTGGGGGGGAGEGGGAWARSGAAADTITRRAYDTIVRPNLMAASREGH
jgi:hypothetical protein